MSLQIKSLLPKLLLVLALLPAAGCSRTRPRPSGSFSGIVQLDGKPLDAGSISFTSLKTGETSYTNLDSAGHFQVKFPEGDVGATYDVTVGQPIKEVDAIEAMNSAQTKSTSKVPPRYANRATSKLTAQLAQPGDNQVSFELTTDAK